MADPSRPVPNDGTEPGFPAPAESAHGRFLATREREAWTFSNHKTEPASVPFQRTFARTGRPGGRVE